MNSTNSSFAGAIPPVTKNILILNLIMWGAKYLLAQKGLIIEDYLGLHYVTADAFMPHQFITYMFMHGGFSHMFFNMFAVFMFGRTLEAAWGAKRFLIYYILTGIFAGVVQEIAWTFDYRALIFNPAIETVNAGGGMMFARAEFLNLLTTVGASGSVFGILLAFGMMFPDTKLFIIPFPFPIKAKWFVVGYGLLELSLGVANRTGDNVAHFAHLGGLVAGFFIIMYWRQKAKQDGRYF